LLIEKIAHLGMEIILFPDHQIPEFVERLIEAPGHPLACIYKEF